MMRLIIHAVLPAVWFDCFHIEDRRVHRRMQVQREPRKPSQARADVAVIAVRLVHSSGPCISGLAFWWWRCGIRSSSSGMGGVTVTHPHVNVPMGIVLLSQRLGHLTHLVDGSSG